MRLSWISLLTALFQVISADAGETDPAVELPLLPVRINVGEVTYTVAPAPSDTTAHRETLRLRKDKQPLKSLGDVYQYWLDGDVFLRPPDGRFAIPYSGYAPFVGYIDLTKNEFVGFNEPFPATGETPGDEPSLTKYEWTGMLKEGEEHPDTVLLFVRRWDREKQVFASHRVSIPVANPQDFQVEAMSHLVVEKIFVQLKNELLCQIVDDGDRNWARISTDTWTVLAKGKLPKELGHLGHAVFSPNGRDIYAVYSLGGLVIFNAENGDPKIHHRTVGGYFNAFTLGPTFDPDGSLAVVSTPYQHRISLIDVETRRIIAEYKTATPLAGIQFNRKDRKAYAHTTMLPYE